MLKNINILAQINSPHYLCAVKIKTPVETVAKKVARVAKKELVPKH
jgi:hypothetical protein